MKVFHAGTALQNGGVVTAGGRVLNVTALGDSIAKAKLQRLSGGEVHPLARRLVPQRYFRQGDAAGVDVGCVLARNAELSPPRNASACVQARTLRMSTAFRR